MYSSWAPALLSKVKSVKSIRLYGAMHVAVRVLRLFSATSRNLRGVLPLSTLTRTLRPLSSGSKKSV